MAQHPFRVEAFFDFVDDALLADHPLAERDLDAMMRALAEAGVGRVAWAYYADERGGWCMPGSAGPAAPGLETWQNGADTYRLLGHPLRAAVQAGHRHGLEVYAYFKPYETGVSVVFPEGSPEAAAHGLVPHGGGMLGALDPFVRAHPELRIRRRPGPDDTARPGAPACAIQLVTRDDAPTRMTAEHVQVWSSPNNYQYRPVPAAFAFADQVQPSPREVRDHAGRVLTRQGDPVRVLTLSGLRIRDPYVLVTTDFTDGKPDFTNAATALLRVLDDGGRELPGETATGAGLWVAKQVDFRKWGLAFDTGFGGNVMKLDEPNASGKAGLVAWARGKNQTLPAALCETEPEVQAFWLRCLQAAADAGVDGVDFREENHCTHTDDPGAFGFNPVVLEQCRPGADLPREAARVRGAAYTDFLRKARQLLSPRGIRMRYHLNMDWFRPDPPPARALAYPANLDFNWRAWVAEGLLDEAVLRSYQLRKTMLTDAFGAELADACRQKGVPLTFNHHVFADEPWYLEEALRAAADGRFAGLILYETQSFLRTDKAGNCRFKLEIVKRICEALTRKREG